MPGMNMNGGMQSGMPGNEHERRNAAWDVRNEYEREECSPGCPE